MQKKRNKGKKKKNKQYSKYMLCITPAYFCVFAHLQVYEQDDLSEQMASLEGLMKQLNAITGSAF